MQKLSEQPHHSSILTVTPDIVNRGEPVLIEFTWYTQEGEAINIEDSENHIKMIGFYDPLDDKYYRFTGGKGNVYTLTTSFISIGQHKLQAFFNHVDIDDKKLLDIYANIRVKLQRSASNPGMSLIAGDAGGVNYDSAERAIQIDTTDGSKFLWYPTGCITKFDPQAENAKTSELLNILKKAGLSYDKNRLDNVAAAIIKLINDNSYSPSKIFACTLNEHNVCDPNFKVVIVTKTEKGCILEEVALNDLLHAAGALFNIEAPYTPALAKILDGDKIEAMDIVFQAYVNNQGKPENQLKTMKFTEFLHTYVPKISEPFKDNIIDKQDTDDGLQAVLVKKLPNGDNQLVKTPISDIIPDTSFDISKPFKNPIIPNPRPIYRGITEVNMTEKPDSLKASENDLYQLYEGDIGLNPNVPLKVDIPTIDTPTDTALTTVTDEQGLIKLAKAPIKGGGNGGSVNIPKFILLDSYTNTFVKLDSSFNLAKQSPLVTCSYIYVTEELFPSELSYPTKNLYLYLACEILSYYKNGEKIYYESLPDSEKEKLDKFTIKGNLTISRFYEVKFINDEPISGYLNTKISSPYINLTAILIDILVNDIESYSIDCAINYKMFYDTSVNPGS